MVPRVFVESYAAVRQTVCVAREVDNVSYVVALLVPTCGADPHSSRPLYLAVDRDTFVGPISHVDLDPGPARHAAWPMTDGARSQRSIIIGLGSTHSRCETIPRRAMQSRLNGKISNCAMCNWHVRRKDDAARPMFD